ncbi:MAG: WecB/TagA/CpsF family glycosyltransferase [Terriglobia bacterium]
MEKPSFKVLGVRVDAVQIPDVIAQMEHWIAERERSHFIAVTGMHGVTEAHHRSSFRAVLEEADLVVADGMPLVWLGRWHGFPMRRRVYGPDLMAAFCALTANRYRHFFYGGVPGLAEQLGGKLAEQCGIQVAGSYSPPFRALTGEEALELSGLINATAADVVWVGLSTPKQEYWMWRFRPLLNVPVLVGVGAAYDFLSGRVKQAPRYVRDHGFEWLYRLLTEPRRLWRRYLINGPEFALKAALEAAGVKKFT